MVPDISFFFMHKDPDEIFLFWNKLARDSFPVCEARSNSMDFDICYVNICTPSVEVLCICQSCTRAARTVRAQGQVLLQTEHKKTFLHQTLGNKQANIPQLYFGAPLHRVSPSQSARS